VNSIIMQALDLVLLTLAALLMGYKLGSKRRPPTPFKIGQRVVRLKPTRKGNYKPVQGFVHAIVGPMVRILDLDHRTSTWVRENRIARR